MTEIQAQLFSMQDAAYRDFHAKLIPNIDKETIIGVRTPQLRAYAKALHKNAQAEAFLRALPHTYYEENNLHGMLLSLEQDYDACIAGLEKFLPYIDNWATCDLTSPKCFHRHHAELIGEISRWLASGEDYTVRFGVDMLMAHYLDEDFKEEVLSLAASVHSEAYYVRMAQAWFFATALAKQYEATLPYLEQHRLDAWTHNKAIQKAKESYRVSEEHKTALLALKII